MEVTVHEAKSQLSRLLKLAEDGETVTIVRCGIPVARLTPVPPPVARRLGWGCRSSAGFGPAPPDRRRSRSVSFRQMSALLDTCAVLWAARQPERPSPRVRALLLDEHEEVVLSVVSAWEITLKPALGIPDVAGWLRQAARNLQARMLPVRLEHIAALETLPLRHRDPFDRLLVAQAVAGRLMLVTPEEAIQNYSEVEYV